MLRRCLTFVTRGGANGCVRTSSMSRSFCTDKPDVSDEKDNVLKIDVDQDTGVAKLCLNRPPVNALNYGLLESIHTAMDYVETEQKCTGMLWTSSSSKTFCGGLDLTELIDPDPEYMWNYWTLVQEVGKRLYGSPLPMVNAINGHTIAGGMIMGLSADYNICAKGNYLFGLNECAFGISPPYWLQEMLIKAIGDKKAEQYIKQGKLFNLDEALKMGVVDEIVEQDDLMKKAEETINKWIKIPSASFQHTKSRLREGIVTRLEETREAETEYIVKSFTDPEIISLLKSHLSQVQKGKDKS